MPRVVQKGWEESLTIIRPFSLSCVRRFCWHKLMIHFLLALMLWILWFSFLDSRSSLAGFDPDDGEDLAGADTGPFFYEDFHDFEKLFGGHGDFHLHGLEDHNV